MSYWKNYYSKLTNSTYWKDPVWSKVIGGIILGSGGMLLGGIILLWKEISIKNVLVSVIHFGQTTNNISNAVIVICASVFAVLILVIWRKNFLFSAAKAELDAIKTGLEQREDEQRNTEDSNDKEQQLPLITVYATVFFWERLSSAFPGHRGLQWYDAKTAVLRLARVLESPLTFTADKQDSYVISSKRIVGDPIWWYRGSASSPIWAFKTLSKTKCLVNNYIEIEINRIAVYYTGNYDDESFIYIEAKAEKPSGVRPITTEEIKSQSEYFGYASEEYGLFGQRSITIEEYHDGATIINGKPIDINAELRLRYLTNYNLIISSKQSKYNSRKFDEGSKPLLNGSLIGNNTAEEFIDFAKNFHKPFDDPFS
jgi:hypothetical protein